MGPWAVMGRYSDAAVELEAAFTACKPKARKLAGQQLEWEKSLNRFNQDARAIRARYRLGPLGRAIVAFRLQKLLIANGHPPEVVRQLVFSMILNAFVS